MKKIMIVFIIMLFGFGLVGCKDKEGYELDRDTLKQDLKSYVNKIVKSETIKVNLGLVDNLIKDRVDTIEVNDYRNNRKQIESKIKEEIDSLILTKELEDQIKEDFGKYEHKDWYGYEINPNARCYGIYNDAVVMFVMLPADVEKNIKVDEFNFYYPSNFAILVWHNSTFYSFEILDDIEYLMNNKILSKNNINSVYDVHCNWNN